MTSARLYSQVSLIRALEQKLRQVYPTDVIQQPIHLSIGQEAIPVAVCSLLTDKDKKIGTHRSHALYLACGGSLKGFFSELLGRKAGCCGGSGGSMHLRWLPGGFIGSSSIVGGNLPIAVGLGESAKARADGSIVCVFFGDGACDQGVFYESLNWASLRKLPILFICLDDGYAVWTKGTKRQAGEICAVGQAVGMSNGFYSIMQTSNAVELRALLDYPVCSVRENNPWLVVCETVRRYDHHGVKDDVAAGFRPESERALFDQYDPVKMTGEHVNGLKRLEIRERNHLLVGEAWEQANET